MASQKSLDALEAANRALQDLQRHLEPLLDLLQNPHATRHQRALAQAGVALALGTLRLMGPKFLIPSSRKKQQGTTTAATTTTPNAAQLRSDLNHMRQLFVQVRKKNEELTSCSKKGDKTDDGNEDSGVATTLAKGAGRAVGTNKESTRPSDKPGSDSMKEPGSATAGNNSTTTKQSATSPAAAKRKESPAAKTSPALSGSKKRRRQK